MNHDAENEAEEEQGLNQGKKKGEKELFPLPPYKAFCVFPEDDLERWPYDGKKPGSKEKEKKEAEGAGEPL